MAVIETKKLTKNYGTVRGVTELTLNVEEGDFFGFIGPNGAGKSTTIRTLLGLISPTAGTASVLGHACTGDRVQLLQEVGYMPSEAMFYNGMRVREVIALSAGLHKRDCTAEAATLCKRLSLDTEKRIDELSLGNRKKVAIVCALQHKPKLYILDEPTSGLDPFMQKAFFELLQERSQAGATIFLSSHVLPEIQHYCNRAAIIRDGRLAALDSVENLMKTKAKRVTLQGVSAVPAALEARSVTESEHAVSFLYQGDIQALLQEISRLPIEDMTITDPDLEEIFMHYYTQEET